MLIRIILATSIAVQMYSGYAAHYRPELMQEVSYNRSMPVVDCMIASPYESLGTWLIVRSRYNGAWSWCRVTDIAHPDDRQTIIDRGIVAELSFEQAQRMCGIEYYAQEPPSACPVDVFVLR